MNDLVILPTWAIVVLAFAPTIVAVVVFVVLVFVDRADPPA